MPTHYLLACWLLLLGALPARATHLLGGEMTSRFVDRNGPAAAPLRYELTVNIYVSCNTTPALLNGPIRVSIYSENSPLTLTTLNSPDAYTDQQGNTFLALPYQSQTACVQPVQPPGCTTATLAQTYLLTTYRGLVNLPLVAGSVIGSVPVAGFYAIANTTSRVVGLANISNSVTQGMVLTSWLAVPPLVNHAPVFADLAVAIVCAGDTTYLLNNAVDADGDRLTYEFGQPYSGVASGAPLPTPYAPGYSMAAPLGATGSVALDPATGLARYFTPQPGYRYVIAVDVKEYRRVAGAEVLVGITRRDLALVVANCEPTPPPVLAPAPHLYTVAAGATLRLPITATQPGGHPLRLTVNSVLLDGPGGYEASVDGDPGTVAAGALTGTVSRQGTGGAVAGTLSFAPPCTAAAGTYDVALTVLDEGCAGKTIHDVYRITVLPRQPPVAIEGQRVVCGAPTTQAYAASGGTGPVRWRAWGGSIVGSATANPVLVRWPAPGTYRLVVQSDSTGRCASADSVVAAVTVLPGTGLAVASNLTICPGGSTTLSASGSPPYTLTGGPAPLTGPGPFTLSPGQTTVYTLAGTALPGGCVPTAQVVVRVQPLPPVNAGPLTRPAEAGVPLVLGAPPRPGYTYRWSPATGLSNPTSANPTLTLANRTGVPLRQFYTLTVTDLATGCTGAATVVVTVAPATDLTVYNIVTPNGDQRNDVLHIDNVRAYPGNVLTIYNRFGRQVFTTTNYDNDTNSWGSAPDVAPGIYYYLFEPGKGPALKGWVEVVK